MTKLTNCYIVDVNADCAINSGEIEFDDCITNVKVDGRSVTRGKITVKKVGSETVVDCGGAYVMPGLINAHAHLFGSGKPSKTLGDTGRQQRLIKLLHTKIGAVILRKIVEGALKNELKGGVTTVRTMGDFLYSDIAAAARSREGDKSLPTVIAAGTGISVTGGHASETFAAIADTAEAARGKVRELKENGADFIKLFVTGGVTDAKVKGEPGVLRMSEEIVAAACDEAHKNGMIVAAHIESAQGVDIGVRCGVDSIEHAGATIQSGLEEFRARGGNVTMTFSPAYPLAKLTPDITKLNELCRYNTEVVLDGMIACGKQCLANDIKLAIGTDASCPLCLQYGFNYEVRYFAKLLNTTNATALKTATIGNALALGIEKTTGSIEIGKRADMVMFGENPVENLAATANIKAVVVRGKVMLNPRPKRSKKTEKELDKLFKTL